MQIILHAGAHHTDGDRLLKCLLRNKPLLARHGVAVPGPGKYRTLLKETFHALDLGGAPASGQAREVLMDAMLDEETAERVILSNANFFGSQRYALGLDGLYPQAVHRMEQVSSLFPDDRVELFMALRNPATFVPAVLRGVPEAVLKDRLHALDMRMLCWADLLADLREALPRMPITVWCNEDTPLIWPELIRTIGALPEGQKLQGGFDLLREIMSREGMQLLRAYLSEHPDLEERQKRAVMVDILEAHAIDEAIEEELDLPGWTEEVIEELTALYDHDVEDIAALPGVTLIAP